jgi:hypothetical protein
VPFFAVAPNLAAPRFYTAGTYSRWKSDAEKTRPTGNIFPLFFFMSADFLVFASAAGMEIKSRALVIHHQNQAATWKKVAVKPQKSGKYVLKIWKRVEGYSEK